MMKKLQFFICTLAILLCTTALQAQVAVNTSGGNPHVSAMLDVQSTSKGFLLPRLTTAQRTALAGTATPGLMVYDTSLGKFFYFTGSGWTEGSVGGLWTKTGSYTNLTNLGDYVGIGTTSPSRALELAGNARTLRLTSPTEYSTMEFVSSHATDWSIGVGVGSIRMASSTTGFASSDNRYFFGTSYFHAYADNARELGIDAYRWKNIYSYDGNFADDVTVSDDLWVSGSMGVGTTSPDRTFEVVGPWQTARLTSSGSGSMLEFVSTSADDWAITTWLGNLFLLSSTDDFATKTDEYVFTNTDFYPNASNSKSIGTASKRWNNVFATVADFAGDVTVNRLTAPLTIYDGANQNSIVYITPMTTASEDSSTLFLAEDADATFGMYWLYDGVGNQMELWGKSGTSHYGPHLLVDRYDGDMAIGGSTMATGYKLSVHGKIMCEEVRVDLVAGWPDYVFGKDYKLMSLMELDNFIQTNGHLPNIPAAEEVNDLGLEMGEMQRLMMEKIEELSLYIIEQKKISDQQQAQIEELKEQIIKNQD